MPELSDHELLDALGVEAEPEKQPGRSPQEERIIAGFEEIQRFVEEQGRLPEHSKERDIFERMYAVRLDRICELDECRTLVAEIDDQGLLDMLPKTQPSATDDLDDEALLSELGADAAALEDHLTNLKHVRPSAEIRAAEEIANRTRCNDFDKFEAIFEAVQTDIDNGVRKTVPFQNNAAIHKGDIFILLGQKAYVADQGEEFISEYGRPDSRLRVIYDNGTESDLLTRSLQRALNKDEHGRRITDPRAGPLFLSEHGEDELASGTIYVVRSKSNNPQVSKNREVLHKIGVTSGKVSSRIANAKKDPTFLLADVEVVATYELYSIDRTKIEHLIHTIFNRARLEIQIKDRFGNPVAPREWFMVPLFVIHQAVEMIKDGTIKDYIYNPDKAEFEKIRTD